MDFYASISKHYDFIFPFSPAQVEFVKKYIPQEGAKILDIGCGTGNLSTGLNDAGYTVEAIDFDSKMIEKAIAKNKNIHFQQMDMLNIANNFKTDYFDGIVTFGNTLVHILDNKDIEKFLLSAHQTLKKGGIIAIQILNYQNIVDNKIDTLPLIENEEIKFERKYQFRKDKHVDFITSLTIKNENQTIKNSIELNPIYGDTLKILLKKAGFTQIKVYGNFKMDLLKRDSIPLIIKGVK